MPDLTRSSLLAVKAFLDDVQSVISCVTKAVVSVTGYAPREIPHALTLAKGIPVPLVGSHNIGLSLTIPFRVEEQVDPPGLWKVKTAAYYYTFTDSADDREIVAFHWHPEDRGTIKTAHLHVGYGARVQRLELLKAHLPTGRIALEDVIRCAITELDVAPLQKDWDNRLKDTRERFEKSRTW